MELIERISVECAYSKSNKRHIQRKITKRETMKRLLLLCVLVIWGWSHAEAQIWKNPGDVFFQQSMIEYNHTFKGFDNGLITRFDQSLSYKKPGEAPCESNPVTADRSVPDNSSEIIQNGWGNKALISLYDKTESTGADQSGSLASLEMY